MRRLKRRSPRSYVSIFCCATQGVDQPGAGDDCRTGRRPRHGIHRSSGGLDLETLRCLDISKLIPPNVGEIAFTVWNKLLRIFLVHLDIRIRRCLQCPDSKSLPSITGYRPRDRYRPARVRRYRWRLRLPNYLSPYIRTRVQRFFSISRHARLRPAE